MGLFLFQKFFYFKNELMNLADLQITNILI